jgi:two-component system, cell cycle sensor histidine kinase and response regulator CckA
MDGHPGPYALLAVSDDGAGMDAVTRERAFEPFYTTKGEDEGTGLGLATVYGIVKQHGGGITIDSEPGRGTAIRVYLPRLPGVEETDAPPSRAEHGLGGNETILVAEDEEPVLRLVRDILKAHGYKVLAASGPEKALALAQGFDGTIHLLLTDVVMPKMNGRRLYEELSRVRPETRALYMSGYADEVIGQQGMIEPEIHILQKPFSVTSLTRDVRRVLDR